jgi:transglutaminase-like putative cysteine protease
MPDSPRRLAVVPIALFAVALIALVVLVLLVGRDPVVEAIEPSVVSAGDEVTIGGRHFGESISTLSFSGRELPTSSITEWSGQQITFRVPPNVSSGMLYVVTERGRSDGVLLQVRTEIPRTSVTGEGPGAPAITELDSLELSVGRLVTLIGENFGRTRRSSRVVFPMQGRVGCESCPEAISYASWSDSEIVVRVPSGAASGFLSVVTPWGVSNPVRVTVARPAGEVVAERPAEIALRYGARIDSVDVTSGGDGAKDPGQRDIALRLPTVTESLAQRAVRYLEDGPAESRFESVDASFHREVSRTLLVDRYELRTDVDPSRLSAAYEAETGFFAYYTRALPDMPANDPQLLDVAARLRRGRASPYWIAEAAYTFTLDTLTYALGRADRSALAGLQSGYGDDFTYATLFVAALRAARVPARPVGGVIVTDDGHAYPHFWAEFFVSGVGWIPVDPSLGDGAFPARFPVPQEPRSFYFGNLDNRRVAFRRGYDATEATFLDGLTVVPDDPYTLQRSYAQAGSLVDSFRLSWHNPRVIGLFVSD